MASGSKPFPPAGKPPKDPKKDRLAKALKDNLLRRKAVTPKK